MYLTEIRAILNVAAVCMDVCIHIWYTYMYDYVSI